MTLSQRLFIAVLTAATAILGCEGKERLIGPVGPQAAQGLAGADGETGPRGATGPGGRNPREHAAHWGYHVGDEPGATQFAGFGRIAAEIERLNPDHVKGVSA